VAGSLPAAGFDAGRYDQIPVIELLRAAARGWVGVDRRFLKSILDRGDAGLAEALAFSREPHDKDRIGLDSVLVDIFRYRRSPEALDFLIEQVRRQPEDTGDELNEALFAFGEPALEPLLKLYEEVGEERGHDIAFLLAGLRVRDPRVLAILLDRLEFDVSDGAFLLGIYGDPAARPALEKMLAEIPETDEELRHDLTGALDRLQDSPEPYEAADFDIYSLYPEKELPEFDVLTAGERLDLTRSADPEIRAAAVYSFFNSDLAPKTRAAFFDLAKSDPDPAVRGRAWETLADAADDPEIRQAMIAVLSDPSRPLEERGGAAVGLYPAADQPGVRPLIEALYEEGSQARAKALESMWRSLYKPFAKYFAPHLDDKDPAILRQALRGAGYFRLTSQAGKIASYFQSEDSEVREDALFAYALAMPGETSRGRARGMVRKIDALAHLSRAELRLVLFGIDERLRLHGLEPVFENVDDWEEEEKPEPPFPGPPQTIAKAGRNDPCPCGSGKKYKKCHGA